VKRIIYKISTWADALLLGFRKVTGRKVQKLFLKRYNLLIKTGKSERDALLSTITFFRYREPFIYLSDEDIKNLLGTSNAVLVAKLFARCVEAKNIKPIRESMPLKKYDFTDHAERGARSVRMTETE